MYISSGVKISILKPQPKIRISAGRCKFPRSPGTEAEGKLEVFAGGVFSRLAPDIIPFGIMSFSANVRATGRRVVHLGRVLVAAIITDWHWGTPLVAKRGNHQIVDLLRALYAQCN